MHPFTATWPTSTAGLMYGAMGTVFGMGVGQVFTLGGKWQRSRLIACGSAAGGSAAGGSAAG